MKALLLLAILSLSTPAYAADCARDTFMQEKLDDSRQIVMISGNPPSERNREMCRMRDDGLTYREIAERMTRAGHPMTKQNVINLCNKEMERQEAVLSGVGVSERAFNVLKRLGISRIGQLRGLSISRIINTRGAGLAVTEEIVTFARKFGIVID